MTTHAMPVCVLVGLGPGLGTALAERFARGGCRVAAIGRRIQSVTDAAAALRSKGLEASGFAADAADPKSMTDAFAEIRSRCGPVSILIYNAAMIEPARFVTQSGSDEVRYAPTVAWRARGAPADVAYLLDAFKINVAGALHAVQQALPDMRSRGRGTILLTGGVLAFDPWLEWGVTALGKAALRSLGLSLAKELTPEGIHVVTVAIHGTMQPGTPYDPALVANAYWSLHRQPNGDWQPEYHYKPESAASNPRR